MGLRAHGVHTHGVLCPMSPCWRPPWPWSSPGPRGTGAGAGWLSGKPHTCPRESRWGGPVVHVVTCPSVHLFHLSSPFHFPAPLTVLPGIPSQINDLYPNPCLVVWKLRPDVLKELLKTVFPQRQIQSMAIKPELQRETPPSWACPGGPGGPIGQGVHSSGESQWGSPRTCHAQF